jgi:hypothetical protein
MSTRPQGGTGRGARWMAGKFVLRVSANGGAGVGHASSCRALVRVLALALVTTTGCTWIRRPVPQLHTSTGQLRAGQSTVIVLQNHGRLRTERFGGCGVALWQLLLGTSGDRWRIMPCRHQLGSAGDQVTCAPQPPPRSGQPTTTGLRCPASLDAAERATWNVVFDSGLPRGRYRVVVTLHTADKRSLLVVESDLIELID